MKVIIAGSRDCNSFTLVCQAIKESGFIISEVVSGTARGIDKTGEYWAMQNNIPIKEFIPNWDLYGKSAGIMRNLKMADYADALIAIWDYKSPGTKHMIKCAKKKDLKIFILPIME